MTQPSLFSQTRVPRFDGVTYEPTRDGARLASQLERVRDLMLDGEWRTIPQIAAAVGGSDQSISARLRDLRKRRFGSYQVDRAHVKDGLFTYRVRRPL